MSTSEIAASARARPRGQRREHGRAAERRPAQQLGAGRPAEPGDGVQQRLVAIELAERDHAIRPLRAQVGEHRRAAPRRVGRPWRRRDARKVADPGGLTRLDRHERRDRGDHRRGQVGALADVGADGRLLERDRGGAEALRRADGVAGVDRLVGVRAAAEMTAQEGDVLALLVGGGGRVLAQRLVDRVGREGRAVEVLLRVLEREEGVEDLGVHRARRRRLGAAAARAQRDPAGRGRAAAQRRAQEARPGQCRARHVRSPRRSWGTGTSTCAGGSPSPRQT